MLDFVDWAISVQIPIIYLTLCITIPSMALYITEIVTIVRHKKFHNSFYALFVMRAIPDLLYVLNSFYASRLPSIIGGMLYPTYSKFPNMKKVRLNGNNNFDGIEKKLLFYALATFLGHALVVGLLLITIITNIDDPKTRAMFYICYPLMMDTGTVALSSWLLLLASGTFRQQLIKDFAIIRTSIRVGPMEGPRNINNRAVGVAVGHQLQNRFCSSVQQLPKIS